MASSKSSEVDTAEAIVIIIVIVIITITTIINFIISSIIIIIINNMIIMISSISFASCLAAPARRTLPRPSLRELPTQVESRIEI